MWLWNDNNYSTQKFAKARNVICFWRLSYGKQNGTGLKFTFCNDQCSFNAVQLNPGRKGWEIALTKLLFIWSWGQREVTRERERDTVSSYNSTMWGVFSFEYCPQRYLFLPCFLLIKTLKLRRFPTAENDYKRATM